MAMRIWVLFSLLKYKPEERFVCWLEDFGGITGWAEPAYPFQRELFRFSVVSDYFMQADPETLSPFTDPHKDYDIKRPF